jgi:hypothetical protein
MTATLSVRHPAPTVTLYCPGCERTFVHTTRAGVERLFAEHLEELRSTEGHEPCPF